MIPTIHRKKGRPDMEEPSLNYARSVKSYYVAGEFYDWVTDPRALERIFH